MRTGAWGVILLVFSLLASPAIPAQAAASTSPDTVLDEAIVEATRARLTEMRQELVRLEDRFYERYNELNEEDEFDVHCVREARTGTRLERRYCRNRELVTLLRERARVAARYETTRRKVFGLRVSAEDPIETGSPAP